MITREIGKTLLCVGVVLASTPIWARDAVPAGYQESAFNTHLPECYSPSVLNKISTRFGHKERTFWNSGLTIQYFEKIKEVAWRPWGRDFIPRRFCSGVAITSDGKKRRVDYSIREGLGFLSVTWNVQWCVTGVDRNLAYGSACRAARP